MSNLTGAHNITTQSSGTSPRYSIAIFFCFRDRIHDLTHDAGRFLLGISIHDRSDGREDAHQLPGVEHQHR